MKKIDLYKKAIRVWGFDSQIDMAIEECSELIKALLKHRRYNTYTTVSNIIEEMADVEQMLDELKVMFDFLDCKSQVVLIKKEKLKKLEKLLNE